MTLSSLMTPTQKASARGVREINISRVEGGGAMCVGWWTY